MTNLKIERLGQALLDELSRRLPATSVVTSNHDASGDLYINVQRAVGDAAIVKFEPVSAEASGALDSLGLPQAVYTPHVTKLGIDSGATGTQASETVTLASVIATDKLTINGHDFVAVAGAPVGDQFDVSGTDAQAAASLAAAINASATAGITGIVTASNVPGEATVTITAVAFGTLGNSITVTQTGGTITVPTATLAGGVNPTAALTSATLRNLLVALCAPTGTALIIYEKAGIVLADLIDPALVTNVIQSNPWGQLAQV
jgi:hypothetical protein